MNKIVLLRMSPKLARLSPPIWGKHDMDVVVEPRGDRAEELLLVNNPIWYCWISCCWQRRDDAVPRPAQPVAGPIVLLTSLDSDMNHILSLEMGASDYILKTTCGAAGPLTFASAPARASPSMPAPQPDAA